jgi:6-hydroxynicotinate 3-monooxygenase
MDRTTRIAIIGAGLGGLTAAGFLHRAGFPVRIYEQADAFSRIGAGIILSANVSKVLRRLDVERGLIDRGIRPDSFISRAWDTGQTLYEIVLDEASEKRFGGPYLNIHRGDLHAVLGDAVPHELISFGHRLSGVETKTDGLRLAFDNRASVEADIIIGADGIRSRVREQLLGPEPPRFIGKVAQRAILPTQRLRGTGIRDCTKWWGPDRHILTYYMTSKRDEIYVIGVVPALSWDSDAAWLPCSRDELLESFAAFHPDLQRVLEVTSDVTVWPIYDRERNDRWSGDRVVLIGDACHPMRPFMAAGAAMAVEDAAILSRCLTAFDDPADAFRTYEATRIERVGQVQRLSLENSWMHGPTDVDWFFCYDACTAPLAAAAS